MEEGEGRGEEEGEREVEGRGGDDGCIGCGIGRRERCACAKNEFDDEVGGVGVESGVG